MANAIYKAKYIKPGNNAEGYLSYIATREGVVNVEEEIKDFKSTKKQNLLIYNLLKDDKQLKESEEYERYRKNKTIQNASSFIDYALDSIIDESNVETDKYLSYIATRPRVVKEGTNGLWGDQDSYSLKAEMDKIVDYKGNVFRPILSLKREDATRLGYDNVDSYKELIRTYRNDIAKAYHIQPKNMIWYGAFHDEGDHPHIHLFIYSKDPHEGWLTNKGLETLKSKLFNEMFKDENILIYQDRGLVEEEMMKNAYNQLSTYISSFLNNDIQIENKNIVRLMMKLSEQLLNTDGKKVYGYLKPEIKATVNKIVDLFESETEIGTLYAKWYEYQDVLVSRYKKDEAIRYPLSQNKRFTKMKNLIIREVLSNTKNLINDFSSKELKIDNKFEYDDSKYIYEYQNNTNKFEYLHSKKDDFSKKQNDRFYDYHIQWSAEYKSARKILFQHNEDNDDESIDRDRKKVLKIFEELSLDKNVLAIYEQATMYEKGIGCEKNIDRANELYDEALEGFMKINAAEKNEWMIEYTNYRIGKMFYQGKGMDANIDQAIYYFEKCENNAQALYSLGSIYKYNENYLDEKKSFECFFKSSEKDNAYASLEVAKAYENGIYVKHDKTLANQYYKKAYDGFEKFSVDNQDDRLLYRLGSMSYYGVGCKANVEKSINYLKKSDQLKNTQASILLNKIYLDENITDKILDAVKRLEEINNEENNVYIQYELAKVYMNGKENIIQVDYDKGIEYLMKCIQSNHSPAKYLYATHMISNEIDENILQAKLYLEELSEEQNSYAQYQLAKLYFNGYKDIVMQDEDKGLEYLNLSLKSDPTNEAAKYLYATHMISNEIDENILQAKLYLEELSEEQNSYAQYQLAKLYFNGYKDIVMQDEDKGLEYLNLSLESDPTNEAAKYLYATHMISNEIDENILQAKLYLEELSEEQNSYAQYQLAKLYFNGYKDIVMQDEDKGLEYLNLSLESDPTNEAAKYLYATHMISNEIDENILQAKLYLEELSEEQNSYAQYQLAKLYFNGYKDIVMQDEDKGLEYLNLSLESDPTNEASQYLYGKYFMECKDNTIRNKAIQFLKNIMCKNSYAALLLAKMYFNGNVYYTQNIERGLQYLNIAMSDSNNEFAFLLNYKMILNGEIDGSIKDARENLENLTNSKDLQIQSWSHYYLGSYYLFKNHNEELAKSHLTESANLGNEYAEKLLDYSPEQHYGYVFFYLSKKLAELFEDKKAKGNGHTNRIDRKRLHEERKIKEGLGMKD